MRLVALLLVSVSEGLLFPLRHEKVQQKVEKVFSTILPLETIPSSSVVEERFDLKLWKPLEEIDVTKVVLGAVSKIPAVSLGIVSLGCVSKQFATQCGPLLAYALIEVCWQIARRAQYEYQVPRLAMPAPRVEENFWKRVLAATPDHAAFVESWFETVDASSKISFRDLRQSDIEDWIAKNTFGEGYTSCRATQAQVREMRLDLEQVLGYTFSKDGQVRAEPLAPFAEPVKVRQHPLLLYAFLSAIRKVHEQQLYKLGFEPHATTSAFGYYIKRGHGIPLIFAHGIGAGLAPYSAFIAELVAKADGRPVVLLELPAISMSPLAKALPSGEELAKELERLLRTEFNSPCILIAHSFGSTLCSFLSRYQPHTLKGIVLVEPVCFLLNLAKTTRQVLYCDHTDDAILDLVVQDPGNSLSLRRRFWWHEALCLADDLTKLKLVPSSTVFLADNDNTVPSADVASYLMSTPLKVKHFKEASHGQWQYNSRRVSRVVDAALFAAGDADSSNWINPISFKDVARGTKRDVVRTLVHIRRQALTFQQEATTPRLS